MIGVEGTVTSPQVGESFFQPLGTAWPLSSSRQAQAWKIQSYFFLPQSVLARLPSPPRSVFLLRSWSRSRSAWFRICIRLYSCLTLTSQTSPFSDRRRRGSGANGNHRTPKATRHDCLCGRAPALPSAPDGLFFSFVMKLSLIDRLPGR